MATIPATPWTANSTVPYADQANQDGNRAPAGLTLLYSEDFESQTTGNVIVSGNTEFTLSGFRIASIDQAVSGTKSMKFIFPASPVDEVGNDIHETFVLDQFYTELTFEFYWHVPSNYLHRDGPTGDNNKFLRIWPTNYTDVEKCGLSTQRQTSPLHSSMSIEHSNVLNMGPAAPGAALTTSDFIVAADVGNWMKIKIEVSAARAASDGYMSLYKNDVLFMGKLLPSRGYDEDGYQNGYLMGAANSGYTAETSFHMDDLKVWSGVA